MVDGCACIKAFFVGILTISIQKVTILDPVSFESTKRVFLQPSIWYGLRPFQSWRTETVPGESVGEIEPYNVIEVTS